MKEDDVTYFDHTGLIQSHRIKRCPECFTNIPMDSTKCPWCDLKTKKQVDKNGYAKKPINWKAYLLCLLTWVGIGIYFWWAFFKD